MQSGIDVGAGAGTREGVLNVRGDIPGSVLRRRWCVMPTCLRLPQFREQTEQRSSDFSPTRVASTRCPQYSTSHVLAI